MFLECFKNRQCCMVRLFSKISVHLVTTWHLQIAKVWVVKSGNKASVVHLGYMES